MTGLGRGGQQVQKCRETYVKAVETLVELASLQVRFLSFFHNLDTSCLQSLSFEY